jgi:predicted nucleotidyltransferase
MLPDSELELLRAVFRGHAEIEKVQIFGSRAKGTHAPASDVDLAVTGDLDGLKAEALAAELDELPLPYRFDVVAIGSLKEGELLDHIKRVGQAIYVAAR